MRTRNTFVYMALTLAGLLAACGAVKDKASEVQHGIEVQGHWLMSESEHSGKLEKVLSNDSMVLTFKDGKAAFSPVDTVKGRAVYALVSNCTAGPRPYHMEKNQIVFEAVAGCAEKRVDVQTMDHNTLKFPDPDNGDIVRTFTRIDDQRYNELVKPSDRKL